MLVAVRLRGIIKTSRKIRETFKSLRLNRLNTAVLLKDDENSKNMIKTVENYVAWGKASSEIESMVKIKPRLHPPRKGFRGIRDRYPKGELGLNEKINDLIKRMSE